MDQVVDTAYFEEINRRFDQLCQHFEEELRVIEAGEYIPEGRIDNPQAYNATPLAELKHIGPKKITIDEYRKRQQQRNKLPEIVTVQQVKRKRRAGKKVKLRQRRKELHRLISISKGEQQKILFDELRKLK